LALNTPVSPLTLPAGIYVIGATYSGGGPDNLFEDADASLRPGIDFGIAQLSEGPGLTFPSTDEPLIAPGYFGPNLGIAPEPVIVPEPSTLVLLFSGMVAVAGRAAWKRTNIRAP
jgi:hypothetical protein